MADIKAQLKAKNGDNLYPVTSLAYVSAVSSGGIVISGNSIYTSAIPQANVYRLTTSLGAKQAKCSAGFRTYVSGATIGQNRYFDIAAPVSSGTLTVSAGSAYRIFATGNTVTVNAEGSASSAGVFGLEGHAAILLTNSSYLKFGTNVVLGAPLQIDAINNCTLRFHDGHCIIDVEDHEAAHTVTVATGTGTGSLYYWANWANTTSASATPAYVSFSDALDGTACSFNGVTVNGDKHFVGNGKTLTVVTGTATASSKTYLTNMAISGATITGGTVYATDCLIPSGATTVISSPLIASNTLDIDGTLKTPGGIVRGPVLQISGAGTLDLAAHRIVNSQSIDIKSCTICSGKTTDNGGALWVSTSGCTATLDSCYISGCTATYGGAIIAQTYSTLNMSNCVLTANNASYGGAFMATHNAHLESCTLTNNQVTTWGGAIFVQGSGSLELFSCVISGNQANARGACMTVSSGTPHINCSACTIADNVGNLPIDIRNGTAHFTSCIITGNTSPNDVGAGCYATAAGTTVYIDDCLISGNYCGTTANGGTLYNSVQAVMYVTGTTITGNSAAYTGGTLAGINGATQVYSNCILDGNITVREANSSYIRFGGSNKFTGTTSGYSTAKTITVSSGAILDFTGNTNSVVLNASGIAFQSGETTVIYNHDSAGSAIAETKFAYIDGATFSTLGNGGCIFTNVLRGGTFNGVTINNLSNDNTTINGYTGGPLTIRNSTILKTINISAQNASYQVSLTLGGTITAGTWQGRFFSAGGSSASSVVVTVEPNTIFDTTKMSNTYPEVLNTIAKLIIGSGVRMLNNGVYTAVTAGTYSNVTLKRDGSIVSI